MSQAGILNVAENNPDIPTTFVTDSGTAHPAANILNVFGGAGATTSGAGNTILVTVTSSGFTWHTVTSATNPNTITVENGYICGGVSQVNFLLPVSSNVGDTFIITGYTSLFQIQQGAGQQIFFGTQSTTAGATGTLTSLQAQDHVEILCIVANTTFKVIDSIGNLQVA